MKIPTYNLTSRTANQIPPKRITLLILTLLLITLSTYSQTRQQGYVEKGGLQYSGSTTARAQQSFPNATVTVYNAGTLTLATIYSNKGLSTPKSNPFTADSSGYWYFYAASGEYDIKFSGTGIITPFTFADVGVFDADTPASLTNLGPTKISVPAADPNNPIALGANDPILTFINYRGTFTKATLPSTCSQGQTAKVTDNHRKFVYCNSSNKWIPFNNEIYVDDFGADGSDSLDDAAAISSAISAATAIGSSTSISRIVFTGKTYTIATPITVNLLGVQSSVIFSGAGSSSEILFDVTTAQSAITVSNAQKVIFEYLVFKNNPGDNIGRGLHFNTVVQGIVQYCDFYGVNSNGLNWGGAIYATETALTVKHLGFYGCNGDFSNNTGNITMYNWRGLNAEDIKFIDFGTLNGVLYSTSFSPDGWIRLGNVSTTIVNSYAGGHAVIRDIISDEAGAYTLRAKTDNGSTIQVVEINNWRANNGSQFGFWIENVERASILNSQVAYQPSVVADGFAAVFAQNVKTIEIKHSQFLHNSNNIVLNSNVTFARIENSTYKYLTNTAKAVVEEIVDGKRKQIHTSSTTTPERSGANSSTIYQDSTSGRLRISMNGSPYFNLHGGSAAVPLSDTFTSGTIDVTKWNYVQTGAGNVSASQSGGNLVFSANNACTCDDSAYLESVNSYDFTKYGSVQARLVSHINTGGGSVWEEELTVVIGGVSRYGIRFGSPGGWLFYDDIGSTGGITGNNGLYWRIRYNEGSILFETSDNGASWVTQRTTTTGLSPTNVKFRLRLRGANMNGVTGQLKFDDFSFSQFFVPIINDDGVNLKVGSNGTNLTFVRLGTCTLVAGTCTVSDTNTTSTANIFITSQANTATGALRVSTKTVGTSFVITSSNAGDTGTVSWIMVGP